MTTTKKIQTNSMYGKINLNPNATPKPSRQLTSLPTQLAQAKATVNLLHRVPIQDADFLIGIETLERIIDTAQNQPPNGAADGSIDEKMWEMLSNFLRTCKDTRKQGFWLYRQLEEIGEPLAMQTGLDCPICNSPQFQTPSGPTCKNGHGGVEGVPRK